MIIANFKPSSLPFGLSEQEGHCQTLISSGYNVLSFKYDILIIANQIMAFGIDCSTRSRDRSS